MRFFLSFTPTAKEALKELAVTKALQFIRENPRHPSLQTHEYDSLKGPQDEKIFEAYAQQNTPCAYRIFFYYGRERGEIVIVAITPHP